MEERRFLQRQQPARTCRTCLAAVSQYRTEGKDTNHASRCDTRAVLPAHSQGCRLLFSRCWAQDKDPRREPLWQLAESLGATCQAEYDPGTTTHVVAAAGGTAKVGAAGALLRAATARAVWGPRQRHRA